MSSRLTQLLLALSLLLNCFVLAGFVYRSWIAPPPLPARMGPPPPGPPGFLNPLDALSKELELDDRQRQALKEVFDHYSAARRERYREIQKVRDATSAELQKPAFDMTKVEALVDEMARLRGDQQKENLRSIAQLSPHLRPDQRDELHKILAERYGGGWPGSGASGGPGKPGGPRPPRPPQ
jgi:Spy/CpxP family protein refolding chaperone